MKGGMHVMSGPIRDSCWGSKLPLVETFIGRFGRGESARNETGVRE